MLRIQNSGQPLNDDVQQWINAGSSGMEIKTKPLQTGFGLLIIKRIVHLHNFSFDVSASVEEGNVFRLKMPLHLFALPTN
jgi:light-regulated signal transduction histidine kinase (bacteriophytochrome)